MVLFVQLLDSCAIIWATTLLHYIKFYWFQIYPLPKCHIKKEGNKWWSIRCHSTFFVCLPDILSVCALVDFSWLFLQITLLCHSVINKTRDCLFEKVVESLTQPNRFFSDSITNKTIVIVYCALLGDTQLFPLVEQK